MASAGFLQYIYHHVFFPTQLPQDDDSSPEHDMHLLEAFMDALVDFKECLAEHEKPTLNSILGMFRRYQELLGASDTIQADGLASGLRQMKPHECLALHIKAQNAGIVVQCRADETIFHLFEVAPTSAAVMQTPGRLRRCFPEESIAVRNEIMARPGFIDAIADLISSLDKSTPDEVKPKSVKSGELFEETRDTVNPRLIKEMFGEILYALGRSAETDRFYKHTRDEICWDNALKPWRRSASWLFLRVATQINLVTNVSDGHGEICYKQIMLYALASFARLASEAQLDSDSLFTIAAKLSRRALKLNPSALDPWLRAVNDTISHIDCELKRRWTWIERSIPCLMSQPPSTSARIADTSLDLPQLMSHLNEGRHSLKGPAESCRETDVTAQRFELSCEFLPRISFNGSETDHSKRISICDFERWVCLCLRGWLHSHLNDPQAYEDIAVAIESYVLQAQPIYSHAPEDMSTLILTTLELWIALDKTTIQQTPLLRDFPPEIEQGMFDCLLLKTRPEMERLFRAEQYLRERSTEVKAGSPSVLRSFAESHGIAVRYFAMSAEHQNLLTRIRNEDYAEQAKKLAEYRDKVAQHTRLLHEANAKSHDTENVLDEHGNAVQRHPQWCAKCRLSREAEEINIMPHEKLLPNDQLEQQAVVFELSPVRTIQKWRDTTFNILTKVLAEPVTQGSQGQMRPLKGYSALINFQQTPTGRLALASSMKPFTVTHYREQKISSVRESNLVVPNAMRYSMHDSNHGVWVSEAIRSNDLDVKCALRLPQGPSSALQYTVSKTTHTTNAVIAGQDHAPQNLNLLEYYSFASLRSGHRLQWRNLLRELVNGNLDFNKFEVNVIVTQAAWQAGPAASATHYLRQAQLDFLEPAFEIAVLQAANDLLVQIQGNWQNACAMVVVSTITSTVLSHSQTQEGRRQALEILGTARRITMGWFSQITDAYRAEAEEPARKDLRIRALEVALICHLTFAVDESFLEVMVWSSKQIADMTECLVNIDEYRDVAFISHNSSLVTFLLQRSTRLSHTFEPILLNRILKDPEGLDSTIRKAWSSFDRGSSAWTAGVGSKRRYLAVETTHGATVQFDLLSGRLLVNQVRLSRLPDTYVQHPDFLRILKGKKIDVFQSPIGGMTYQSRHPYFGFDLHFGMTTTDRLILRAIDQSTAYELIPPEVFEDKLPVAFTRDYVHWLDLTSDRIQWRPLSNAFEPCEALWEMRFNQVDGMRLTKGSTALVDRHSETAKFVYDYLGVLEASQHIHIFLDRISDSLVVNLPRMALDFYLEADSDRLVSRQFRGMYVVDPGVNLGTLTGLTTKVLLQHDDGHSRTLIIPRGSVNVNRTETHVSVKIVIGPELNVRYYVYEVNDVLQRLVDDDSLESKLYRCHLHAVTSYCLADNFTGTTGTEQALEILTSPSVMSFEEISDDALRLLENVESCSPKHSYYPEHLEVMQTVEWSNLPSLSQHPSFGSHVRNIVEHAKSHNIFREKPTSYPSFTVREPQALFEKALIRDSQIRALEYGVKNHTMAHDRTYEGRSLGDSRPSRVCRIAQLVENCATKLDVSQDLMALLERLHQLQPARDASVKNLGYDEKWLEFSDPILRQEFCNLTQLLSTADPVREKYKVLITLSAMAYSEKADMKLIETMLAFATVRELHGTSLDCPIALNLSHKYSYSFPAIQSVVKECLRPMDGSSPESRLPKRDWETNRQWKNRKQNTFQNTQMTHTNRLVEAVTRQWTNSKRLQGPFTEHNAYIDVNKALLACQSRFQSWDRNCEFSSQVSAVQSCLDNVRGEPESLAIGSYVPQRGHLPQYNCCPRTLVLDWDQALFSQEQHSIYHDDRNEIEDLRLREKTTTFDTANLQQPEHAQLDYLLTVVSQEDAKTLYEKSYLQRLSESLAQLRSRSKKDNTTRIDICQDDMMDLVRACAQRSTRMFDSLCRDLADSYPKHEVLPHAVKFSWRFSSSNLLKLIASNNKERIHPGWKTRLIQFGLSIAQLQHARRIAKAIDDGSDILHELTDYNHNYWSPEQRPDWLLFELENDLLIRKTQIDVANAMIFPTSGRNSLMQLNMGEGKSSVIVPIAAAALGDGTRLTRIIILKPLAKQMLALLTRKLGGLLGRRVFRMPVSRSNRFTASDVGVLRKSLEDCLELGGILLLQPEHILSFHLMGIERSLEEPRIGSLIYSTNQWLSKKSRDVLDESDELLNPREELIYAIGNQQNIDLGPQRWTLVQHILGLLQSCISIVQDRCETVQVKSASKGDVPHIRILDDAAANIWIDLGVDQILKEGLPGLPSWFLGCLPSHDWKRFFQDPSASEEIQQRVKLSCKGDEPTWKRVLFLRGLFAQGVIQYTFQKKRWRVDYGKDVSRTKLAVPYRAKDTPSPQSEFSHPDVAILLTCLSYYYEHLAEKDLYLALETVFQLDDAADEYSRWTKFLPTIPEQYRTIAGVNMRDPMLPKTVFPFLRQSKAVIDFFLCHHVFPREMKEFPQKLSASGWDLARTKSHPVTGFSGTNDSRDLLPLAIEQHDLAHLQDTNARMLSILIQAENKFFPVPQGSSSRALSESDLLDAATLTTDTGPIRVILDVGAQILEMSNRDFCQAWLGRLPEDTTKAVVFFDERNDLCVMDRSGHSESLAISSFAKRMGECVVYLDESHTRGTDLKLPRDYRAAVTLGPALTKDKLAQACMRMRKLGRGQSVTFVASSEITKAILECCGKEDASDIQVVDVLRWSIQVTWAHMKRCAPLWNTQRKRHALQQPILQSAGGTKLPADLAGRLLEPEAQTIEQRYGSQCATDIDETLTEAVKVKLASFELSGKQTAALDEEQERELAPEIEREQQNQRPPRRTPKTHSVHNDLRHLVRTGSFNENSAAFMRAFRLFDSTTARSKYPAEFDREDLWITKDFAATIELTNSFAMADDYVRPVNWVLRPKGNATKWAGCLIISPFEANELLPAIRESRFVDLPLFSARKSVLARPLEGLAYCNVGGAAQPVSRRLSLFLGLFAGQVYFNSYDEYVCLCRALGLLHPAASGCSGASIDGFVGPLARGSFDGSWAADCALTTSPVEFLKTIGGFMRKGSSRDGSHLGRVLRGEFLGRGDFAGGAA